MAIANPQNLIREFCGAMGATYTIGHRYLPAGSGHANRTPKNLTLNTICVYAFSLSSTYGASCPAGADRVLRVGKASQDGRISHHYANYATGKGLPHNLETYRFLWPFLGITLAPAPGQWGAWIEQNTDRDQFELDPNDAGILSSLEKYIRGRVGTVFEG